MTRSDVSKGHPEYYRDVAERLAREIAGLLLRQPVRQSRQRPGARGDHRPRDLGADGRAAGCGGVRCRHRRHARRAVAFLRAHRPATCSMVLADPVGSGLASYATTGKLPETMTPWLVEGIGGDSVPPVADFSRVSSTYSIPDAEAFRTCRELLAQGGHHRRHLHRHAARGGAALLPRAAAHASASSPSCATAATSTSPRSTTTTGCSTRASSSARASATCAT